MSKCGQQNLLRESKTGNGVNMNFLKCHLEMRFRKLPTGNARYRLLPRKDEISKAET